MILPLRHSFFREHCGASAPLFSSQHLAPTQILGKCELRDVIYTFPLSDRSLKFTSAWFLLILEVCSYLVVRTISFYFAVLENGARGTKRGTKMADFTVGEACPKCKSRPHARMKRSLWVRLVPLSRHYHCTSCNSNFVSMKDTLSFSWRIAPPSGKQKIFTPPWRSKKGPFRF